LFTGLGFAIYDLRLGLRSLRDVRVFRVENVDKYEIFVVLWAICRGFYCSTNPKPIISYCKIVGKYGIMLISGLE